MNSKTYAVLACFASAFAAQAQIVAGQTDTFDANIMSWAGGASPTWMSTGGNPGGFLQITSTGGSGAGAHLATYNTAQWSGNYTTAGVAAISVDFNDSGSTDLVMRLTFWASDATTEWDSNSTISLTHGTGWHHMQYAIDPAQFTLVQGSMSFANTMSNVNRLMFRHDPDPPSAQGVPIVATLGIDNVHAVPVPEPAAIVGLGLASIALVRRRRAAGR